MATKNETEVVVLNANIDSNLSVNEITRKLIEGGAKMYQRRVKSVEFDDTKVSATGFEYASFTLTLNEAIPAYINDGNDNWIEGQGTLIFTTDVILAAMLRENEDTAWVADILRKNPGVLKDFLSYAEISIVQQDVKEGVNYRNPYSKQRADEVFTYAHNTKANYIVDIKLGETGKAFLEAAKAERVKSFVSLFS